MSKNTRGKGGGSPPPKPKITIEELPRDKPKQTQPPAGRQIESLPRSNQPAASPNTQQSQTVRRSRRVKGKIYKTTDGYFNGKSHIGKPRRVAVVHQRKDDGAVAVVKIYSKRGKSGKAYISGLTLKPDKHPSLTEDSIVGSQVHIGVKDSTEYRSIYTRDFDELDDKLTTKERYKVKRGIHNDDKKHRKTYKKKIRAWKRHFKK